MNKEIKEAAIEVFNSYPTAKKVFITPDCTGFLAEDRARLHNKEYVTVKRNEVMEDLAPNVDDQNTLEKGAKPEKAEVLIEKVANIETIEELDSLLIVEKRKTVVAAVEARRAQLLSGIKTDLGDGVQKDGINAELGKDNELKQE